MKSLMLPMLVRALVIAGGCLLLQCCGDSGGGSAVGFPPPPSLGAQIDREGRPAINTAVTDPFNPSATAHGANQDAYNAVVDPSQWGQFVPAIQTNLAILDAIDGVCGNQLLAGSTATAGRYNTLAGILADDELYLNTNSGSCQTYLAVEANALGITNTDCGGRTPLEDTIAESYSVLATGQLSGVSQGITKDNDGQASLDSFPFLSPAN